MSLKEASRLTVAGMSPSDMQMSSYWLESFLALIAQRKDKRFPMELLKATLAELKRISVSLLVLCPSQCPTLDSAFTQPSAVLCHVIAAGLAIRVWNQLSGAVVCTHIEVQLMSD